MASRITAGPVGEPRIEAIDPRDRLEHALLDQADDRHARRAKLDAKGIPPVIPAKSNRLEIIVDDKERYRQRNKVERLFNKIKYFCRVATRYEKRKDNFFAFITLALIVIMLR